MKSVDEYFKRLNRALKSNEVLVELNNLYSEINRDEIFKNDRFDEKKYPELPSVEVFDGAAMADLVDENTGCLKPDATEWLVDNPLAQLMYAVIWKNGDLCKLGPLVKGVLSDTVEIPTVKNDSYVFYQYGRHLLNRAEPIVDQHTVRAMLYFKYLFDQASLDSRYIVDPEKIHKFDKPRKVHLEDYLEWINSVTANVHKERVAIQGVFDKVVFTLGKHIKK